MGRAFGLRSNREALDQAPFFLVMHLSQKTLPFQFETSVSFFEKADAPEGMERRIGGLVSLESRDRQNEIVLQEGLDWDDFLHNGGWFNDNHSKETDGILGYPDPESLRIIEKGNKCPDGQIAPARGTWVEGYLLKGDGNERYDRIWKLGKALQQSGRRLGYSVQGGVLRRAGRDRKTIAKARVRHVAITNCPVHQDTRLEVLAKSLRAIENAELSDVEKAWESFYRALTAGQAGDQSGPRTGEGAGQLLMLESLEGDPHNLTKSEAIVYVQERYPDVSFPTAKRIVEWAVSQERAR